MRAQDPQGEQDERKEIKNFRLDRNGTFSLYVCIIHSPNMGRRSRTQNAVYTTFSCRGQLHYMDGLRTFKRETRLSFIGGKFARRYLRTNCNNCCLLIKPAGDRSVSLKTIPARGTSHFVLVASRAGNFALRARCKSRGELRTSCSLQVARGTSLDVRHMPYRVPVEMENSRPPHYPLKIDLRARNRADKSAGEKRPSRFSFIGDVNNSCALRGFDPYKSRGEKRSTRFSFIGDAKKSSALLGFFRSCIFPLIAVSYTYIIKLNTNERPAGFGRRIRCQKA